MGEPFFCQLRPCQMKTSKRQVVYQRGYDSTGHNTNVPYWNLLTRRNQAKPAVLCIALLGPAWPTVSVLFFTLENIGL